MAKFLIAIVAAVACLVLVDSLECNKCSGSIFGVCLNSGTSSCTNGSVCFTSKASFSSISSFSGFSSQGCIESSTCGSSNSTTSNGTLPVINVGYTIKTECCSTDKCNPVTLSGASTSTVSLSVLSVAALASVMRSVM